VESKKLSSHGNEKAFEGNRFVDGGEVEEVVVGEKVEKRRGWRTS